VLRNPADPSDLAPGGPPPGARPSRTRRGLLAALRATRARLATLEREYRRVKSLNSELLAELEETNRGVVALYNEEHQLALTLQRTFLPQALPEVPGVDLVVRYLPAASQSAIGGDFYEAIVTPAGLLLAIGDVMGHSLQAAVVMGELRHALRAYTTEGHPPHVLLERLDTLLSRHRPGWTATVCIALIEPGGARLHIANAGHPTPLLVTGAGEARYLSVHGPLLGLGLPQPEATSHPVGPGTRLLMVTDGLVEKRGTTLPDALEQLRRLAADGPQHSERLCDALLDAFGAHQQDDIVILTARLDHGLAFSVPPRDGS
jgi:serine phosphatase RsbU (regulator of sigma subunit)